MIPRVLESGFQPALPPDLVATRRYRGKTNELFTHRTTSGDRITLFWGAITITDY